MTRCSVHGVLEAADHAGRTVTYRLLPYGQPGRTSVGVVTASRGVVQVPDPAHSVVLNLEHDRTRPVGRLLTVEDRPDALVATFHIAGTRAGDDLLTEIDAGLRTGVSVELDGIAIRDGALLAGTLTGAGAVVRPAFEDATALLVASDTDPAPELEPEPDPDAPDPELEPEPDTPTQEDDPMPETPDATATVPASLPALTAAAAPAYTRDAVSRLLAAYRSGDRSPALEAALSDLTYTGNAAAVPPAWIGEVWSGVPFTRQIVPLFQHGDLAAMQVQGWRWATPPVGAAYTGDKTDVPSNQAATEAVTFDADRWAGAHDHDRAFVDFGVSGYWDSYWAAMAASYASWSDSLALVAAKAGASAVVATDAADVLACVIDVALAVIPKGGATFVLLGKTAYADLAKLDPFAFLTGSVSLGEGSGSVGGLAFRTHPGLAAGDVIAGNRNAATFYELGTVPIRVNVADLARGGEDTGAFGYAVLGVHDDGALAKTTYVPAP